MAGPDGRAWVAPGLRPGHTRPSAQQRMASTDAPGPKPSRPLKTLRQAEDFQRVLAQPWLARSAHFAVHFLAAPVRAPMPASASAASSASTSAEGTSKVSDRAELSSGDAEQPNAPVDKSLNKSVEKPWMGALQAPGPCIGFVVPKRLARRAVTRNLIKRQMRQALSDRHAACAEGLADGGWVLRLRDGFDRARYPSAASDALKQATRSELVSLVEEAAERAARGFRPTKVTKAPKATPP